MSSISPPGPTAHMSYGGSPPLRYTQTPPHPSWLGGYLPQGPPQPPPQQPMPMQQVSSTIIISPCDCKNYDHSCDIIIVFWTNYM